MLTKQMDITTQQKKFNFMIKLRIVKIVTNLNPAATTVKLQIVASKIVISIWPPYLPTSGGVVLNNYSDILRILGS
jgi:hypothetical protein